MRDERYYERRIECLRKFASALLFMALLFSFSVWAWAQSGGGGKVEGRVGDERGASVAGAEVRLRSREGLSLFGRTNEDGVYAFTGLGTGDYILEVTARGFAAVTSGSFRVEGARQSSKT